MDELPASEVRFWSEYFSYMPPPDDKRDFMFAQLTAKLHNVNRGTSAPIKPDDLMPFTEGKVWKRRRIASDRYSETDREALSALMGSK